MSSDTVKFFVVSSVGVSLLAGIISGAYYIISLNVGFNAKRKIRACKSPSRDCCALCKRSSKRLKKLHLVACSQCCEPVCKWRCSCKKEKWVCWRCWNKPPSIVEKLSNFLQVGQQFIIKRSRMESNAIIKDNIELIRKNKKEQVRDFIESLVAALLGENVDDASITKTHNDTNYRQLFERYHRKLSDALTDLGSSLHISISDLPVAGQSPCTSHSNLKQIIEKLLTDSSKLPNLQQNIDQSVVPAEELDRSYEDLLATAIINKVVNKYQDDLIVRTPSTSASTSSRLSSRRRRTPRNHHETKWKNKDADTNSNSSGLDDLLYHSDSSLGSTKYVDRVSLTIQQNIEENNSSAASSVDSEGEDIVDYMSSRPSSTTLHRNDSSNWYLQKRPMRNSPVPVPMLVPQPETDAKVLIGDQEVDDTSDLSDVISEYDNHSGIDGNIPEITRIVVESKTIIGGKNALYGGLSDTDSSIDSGMRDGSLLYEEREQARKSAVVDEEDNFDKVSSSSQQSSGEKDAEYIEKYGSLPRKIRHSNAKDNLESDLLLQPDDVLNDGVIIDEVEGQDLFQGVYSRKDREKWNNPIKMKHNPYSKENIEKRIQETQRYGRDYYARQASLPSGAKKLDKDDNENELLSPRSLYLNNYLSEEDDGNIYRAMPAISDDDFTTIVQESSQPPTSEVHEYDSNVSNSGSDLSLINCYNVENSQIDRQPSTINGDRPEIKISVNTEGLLHQPEDEDGIKDEEPKTVEKNKEDEVVVPKVKPRTFKTIAQNVSEKNNKVVYESQLSEEVSPMIILNKKSDNTLIKKIYSNPVVRSFALTNREKIPVSFGNDVVPTFRPEKNPVAPTVVERKVEIVKKELPEPPAPISLNSVELSSPDFSLEFSDGESNPPQKSIEQNSEIDELKEKRLVASRIGQFSKSFPNLSNFLKLKHDFATSTSQDVAKEEAKYQSKDEPKDEAKDEAKEEKKPEEVTEDYFLSVKFLRNRFENASSIKDKPVHSLTARSISKQVRTQLKNTPS